MYGYGLNDPVNFIDPSGMVSRGDIVGEANEWVDTYNYGNDTIVDDFGSGSNKCNKFVYDVMSSVDARVGVNWLNNIPTAGDWASNDPNAVPGWNIVQQPQAGDVMGIDMGTARPGATGHVAIVVGVEGDVITVVGTTDQATKRTDYDLNNFSKKGYKWTFRRYMNLDKNSADKDCECAN